eukprot:scaffold34010_cov115-Skeletonema_marinoi.AAC.2
MADHADDGHDYDGDIFLVHVETHDGIRKVGSRAFFNCKLLRSINLKFAVEIGTSAFCRCGNLTDVEFGDKLETIGGSSFSDCISLKRINLPFIITIGAAAFWNCSVLTDVDISERLETIEKLAFFECDRLERIAIPLKRDLFEIDDDFVDMYTQFHHCEELVTVDLVGGIHKTVSSLHMESWRSEMEEEINRINQVLPDTQTRDKTDEIRQWMDSVLDKMNHYKAEHCRYVKEAITLLELALWKAKLDEKEDNSAEGRTKKAKLDVESARRERRVTCGADIVIKNVETHDGIRRVDKYAFHKCKSLRRINLRSAVEIGVMAFYECENLKVAEFGDKLEIIELGAFYECSSPKYLKLPSITTIETAAFWMCSALTDIEFSERLETIGGRAFRSCECLQRIAIPLKRNLFPLFVRHDHNQIYGQFDGCDQLKTIDLVGGIHKTVASLHMESWRTEMNTEIDRINQVLPTTPTNEKSDEIRQWTGTVIDKMDFYKAEHYRYVKEAITLLELALWKAKLDEKEDNSAEGRTKKAKIDVDSARKERRITCGADMVIKNVLPFLQLE